MITLIIDMILLLMLSDEVGQGNINWVFGVFLIAAIWLNAIAMFRRVFR